MDNMHFSIVIPTYNRMKLVADLLRSLQEDRLLYRYGLTEVLVIDSSEGEERKAIMRACEEFDAVYIPCEASVRKKRSTGIDLAQYEYVLFVDSDVTVEPGLLDTHAETYIENAGNPTLGGTFGMTEFVGKSNFWWKVLELTTFIDSFSFAKQYPYVSWALGNNVSFKKEILLKVGKFEENLPFRLGGDDLDLSYRITKAGYQIKTAPQAVVYHAKDTWNHWKGVNDRSKRWGSMEYHILKRHPELAHTRLPMTGDVVCFMSMFFGAAAVIKQSLIPLAFWGLWCCILCMMLFGLYVKRNKLVNPFYWLIAMGLQGKYRLHRLAMSLKMKDLSFFMKGQFFGREHMQADFRGNVHKVRIYYISILLTIVLLVLFMIFFCGGGTVL